MEYRKEIEIKKKPGRIITTSSPKDVQRRQVINRDSDRIIEELKKQIGTLQLQVNTEDFTPERVDEEIRKAVKNAVTETKGHYEKLLTEIKEREKTLFDRLQNAGEDHNKQLQLERKKYEEKYNKKVTALEERFNNTISQLEDKLKLTEEKLIVKEETIETLKTEKDETVKNLLKEYNKKVEELARSISLKELEVDDPNRPKIEKVFIDPLEKGAGNELKPHVVVEEDSKKESAKDKLDKLKGLMGGLPKDKGSKEEDV